MRLSLYEFATGVETIGGNRVVYDVAADTASFGRATVEGRALVWQLDRDEGVRAHRLASGDQPAWCRGGRVPRRDAMGVRPRAPGLAGPSGSTAPAIAAHAGAALR